MVETQLSEERRKDEGHDAVRLGALSVSIVRVLGLDKLKGVEGIHAGEGISSQLRAVSSPSSSLRLLLLLLLPLSSPSPSLLYSAEVVSCSLDAAASARSSGLGLLGVT